MNDNSNTYTAPRRGSASRLWATARYYYPSIKMQIALYPGIAVLVGLTVILAAINPGMSWLATTATTGMSMMIYLSPASIIKTVASPYQATLPARCVERWLVPAVFFTVGTITLTYLPFFVTLNVYDSLSATGGAMRWFDAQEGAFSELSTTWILLTETAPAALMLYGVMRFRRHTFLKSALLIPAALAVTGFVFGFFCFYEGFKAGMEAAQNGEMANVGEYCMEITQMMESHAMTAVAGISVVISVVFLALSYSALKNRQA